MAVWEASTEGEGGLCQPQAQRSATHGSEGMAGMRSPAPPCPHSLSAARGGHLGEAWSRGMTTVVISAIGYGYMILVWESHGDN